MPSRSAQTLLIDADDTLWENNIYFERAIANFISFLNHHEFSSEQVREVLNLEKRGLWFSKDLSKSILYSVAAPGTSQHISMLALDVTQFADARVRRILANHGWFQTVKSDQPHFTYLGRMEKELPQLGLRSVTIGAQVFWIPDTAGK